MHTVSLVDLSNMQAVQFRCLDADAAVDAAKIGTRGVSCQQGLQTVAVRSASLAVRGVFASLMKHETFGA